MDTIQLNINCRDWRYNGYFDKLRQRINQITSPYGYTYVDFLTQRAADSFSIKVSYPRFFFGINAGIVNKSVEVLEVNRHLVNELSKIAEQCEIGRIELDLIRVDIPFTVYKPEDMNFSDYLQVFRLMSIVYTETRKIKYGPTGIFNMNKLEVETVNFTNNSGNIEVCIYNQALNIQRKTQSSFDYVSCQKKFPDLVNRIRIEVRKRISRKPFSPEQFSKFDVLGEYGNAHREFLLTHLFNTQVISNFIDERINYLDNTFKDYLKDFGRINYRAWLLWQKNNLYDYSVIREVLKRNISNQSTYENAITRVNHILEDISFPKSSLEMLSAMEYAVRNYEFDLNTAFEVGDIVKDETIFHDEVSE